MTDKANPDIQSGLQPESVIGARALLQQLRLTMAERLSAQDRLDKIVRVIGQSMRSQVCSFYVLRDDGALELFATRGLKTEAVHQTSLRLGEGLVGLIAADATMLNLKDAQAHPAFVYRPETGEETFKSFLGVPVLRAGQTLGVLVVQSTQQRDYAFEETEALQTTATLLAEMLSTAEFETLIKPGSDIDLRRPRTLDGIVYAEGLALGRIVLHDPRVVVTNFVAEDIDVEKQRLEAALRTMRLSIDDMFNSGDMQAGSEHRDILESYRMFAHDRGWVRRLRAAIDNGLTAEAAVERVQNDTRARMLRQTDPYIRDRLHDLDDLANRLLRNLTQDHGPEAPRELPENTILVARNIGPAELLEYDRDRLKGLVLEEGGATSHVSIVARSLGLAIIGHVENVASLCEDGDDIIVDAERGQVHLRPLPAVEDSYIEKVRLSAKRQARYASLRDKEAITKDGTRIQLLLNSGLLADLPSLEETGADGIGLFRTELQFMVASRLPRLAEQVDLYRQTMDVAGDKPVTFRILDIGGDKVVPYLRSETEENPAMGWRSLRLALDKPGLFRTQVRALLQAANGRPLDILIPMVTETVEFSRARHVIDREMERLARSNIPEPEKLRIGAMIEVPSLLFELDTLLPLCDFVSIGSNDLLQFLTATDRSNPRLTNSYDPLAAPRLRAFKWVVDACKTHNIPVTMCGELANKPLEALALLGLGFRRLSMSPTAIGPIKEIILNIDIARLTPIVEDGVAQGIDGIAMRALLRDVAERQGFIL